MQTVMRPRALGFGQKQRLANQKFIEHRLGQHSQWQPATTNLTLGTQTALTRSPYRRHLRLAAPVRPHVGLKRGIEPPGERDRPGANEYRHQALEFHGPHARRNALMNTQLRGQQVRQAGEALTDAPPLPLFIVHAGLRRGHRRAQHRAGALPHGPLPFAPGCHTGEAFNTLMQFQCLEEPAAGTHEVAASVGGVHEMFDVLRRSARPGQCGHMLQHLNHRHRGRHHGCARVVGARIALGHTTGNRWKRGKEHRSGARLWNALESWRCLPPPE